VVYSHIPLDGIIAYNRTRDGPAVNCTTGTVGSEVFADGIAVYYRLAKEIAINPTPPRTPILSDEVGAYLWIGMITTNSPTVTVIVAYDITAYLGVGVMRAANSTALASGIIAYGVRLDEGA